jgi:uncharacterized protein (TIGR01777 family)
VNLNIGIFGSGGLIGSEIAGYFEKIKEYNIVKLKSSYLYLTPAELSEKLNGIDILINFTGYPVLRRWSKRTKSLIYKSRVLTTENIFNALKLLERKPEMYIAASAVGIYKDYNFCDDHSEFYTDNFLAKVIRDWEFQSIKIKELGTSVCITRIGIVLSGKKGMYVLLKRFIKMRLGAIPGRGDQGISFILIDDLVKIIAFIIEKNIAGIINAVSPEPLTISEFILKIGERLNRKVWLKIPSFVIKLVLGEGNCILLNGQKAIPLRLKDLKFCFIANNLEECLNNLEK